MSAAVQPAVSDEVIVYNKRRNVELALLLLAQSFGFAGERWVGGEHGGGGGGIVKGGECAGGGSAQGGV